MATQCLNNGRIRFENADYVTSEVVILAKHMRFLMGGSRVFPKGGIARAYECAKQLEETAARILPPGVDDCPF